MTHFDFDSVRQEPSGTVKNRQEPTLLLPMTRQHLEQSMVIRSVHSSACNLSAPARRTELPHRRRSTTSKSRSRPMFQGLIDLFSINGSTPSSLVRGVRNPLHRLNGFALSSYNAQCRAHSHVGRGETSIREILQCSFVETIDTPLRYHVMSSCDSS